MTKTKIAWKMEMSWKFKVLTVAGKNMNLKLDSYAMICLPHLSFETKIHP